MVQQVIIQIPAATSYLFLYEWRRNQNLHHKGLLWNLLRVLLVRCIVLRPWIPSRKRHHKSNPMEEALPELPERKWWTDMTPWTMAGLVLTLHEWLALDLGFQKTQHVGDILFQLDTLAMKQGIPTIYSWRVPNPKWSNSSKALTESRGKGLFSFEKSERVLEICVEFLLWKIGTVIGCVNR